MPPHAPDFPLPVFASLISKPELVADMQEAGIVINCLFRYAKHVAMASRNLTQFMSLPFDTELFPKWNMLVDSTDLHASSRVILREERIENITLEMYNLVEGLKNLATGFPDLTFTEDLLNDMIGLKIMEVVWHVYGINDHTDFRVQELLQTLNFPYSVIDRALDALDANAQPVVDDDPIDDEMPGHEYEVRTREVPENAETFCCICRSEMSEPVALVACGHCFCRPCISNWVNEGEGATNRCPVCRALILTRV